LGELYFQLYALLKSDQLTQNDFDSFDNHHFKLENQLLKLIKTLQSKSKVGEWDTEYEVFVETRIPHRHNEG